MSRTTDPELTIGVLLFEDAEELDVVGPWEVLGFWAAHVAGRSVRVVTVAAGDAEVVRCAKGLRLLVDHSTASMPPLDVLVHPGGDGTRGLIRDEEHLAWLHALHGEGTLLASVCTGSLVLAAAGLLTGRPATTHREHLGKLAKLDPGIDVREERYVDDGEVITSAGVSAGIDMALHLVARLDGAEAGELTRSGIQYEAPATATPGA